MFGQAAGATAADAALINGGLIHSWNSTTRTRFDRPWQRGARRRGAGRSRGADRKRRCAARGLCARLEVLIRFGAATNGFHAKGLMSTSVTGTLASALFAAELMGLDEDRSVAAIGIAPQPGSGVMEFLTTARR